MTGVSTLLAETPGIRVVGRTESSRALLEMSSALVHDVVAIDSTLAKSVRELISSSYDICTQGVVLLVPNSPPDALLIDAASAGIRGLVVRDGPIHEIVSAIETVHAGRTHVDSTVADRLLQLATHSRITTVALVAAGEAALTARERQVLECVADGMSNIEIAQSATMAVRTVKYHLSHVLQKLGARDRAHAVALAYGAGFRSGTCSARQSELARQGEDAHAAPR
jgi:DNA-binding NarL/FixJ family response regulator